MTISGLLDAGIQQTKNGDNTTVTTLGSGIHGASRLRFVGVEDLGGGSKANFWLEMQPSFADGTTSAAGLFNRGAWLGLSGNAGEIRFGRMGTNSVEAICAIDQHGCYSGFYGGGILFSGQANPGNGTQGAFWFASNATRGGKSQATGYLAPFATTSAATGTPTAVNSDIKDAQASSTGALNQTNPDKFSVDATRYVRAVRYSLPTLVEGLSVHGTYAFPNTNANGTLAGGKTTGVNAAYASGALSVVGAYQKSEADVVGYASGDVTTVGGVYNFGVASLGLGYQKEGATPGSLNTGSNALLFTKAESYALTALFPMGATTPYIKLGQRKYSGGTMGDVTGAKILNIGMRYALSKRTNLYADWVNNDAAAGAGTNTSTALAGVASTAAVTGLTGYTSALKTMVSAGIQHTF